MSEGLCRCNLRLRKEHCFDFNRGTKSGLGLNDGKGFKGESRGRKSYMYLAQEKVFNELLARKQISLDGVLKAVNAPVEGA
jgi:hypothetical protein